MTAFAPTQYHAQPSSRTLQAGMPRYAARGQALIMAVLLMFLLIGLAGLFVAVIGHAMVQTARAEDRDRLENIALAGINHAEHEILYSADGADWRPDNTGPDASNAGWVHYGSGFYYVTVSYGTSVNALLDTDATSLQNDTLGRYLKIDVEARYALDNPTGFDPKLNPDDYAAYRTGFLSTDRYLTKRLTKLLPIGLTDHLLWETNIDGSATPITLGTTVALKDFTLPKLTNGSTSTAQTVTGSTSNALIEPYYLPVFDGPIRSNVGVNMGNGAFYLNNGGSQNNTPRTDQIIVNGNVTSAESALTVTGTTVQDAMDPICSLLTSYTSSPFTWDNTQANPLSVKFSFLAALNQGTPNVQFMGNNPLARAWEAPRLDMRDPTSGLDRYRMLTRDSGSWNSAVVNTNGSQGNNTGVVGQGEGLYINNPDEIQYNGDLEQLRNEWLTDPSTVTDDATNTTCWTKGVYDPVSKNEAVEIDLQDWPLDSNGNAIAAPTITLRSGGDKIFYDNTKQVWTDTLVVPYPRNGVIFAEGNVVVKGNLPASLAFNAVPDSNGKYEPLWDTWDATQTLSYTTTGNQLPGGTNVLPDQTAGTGNAQVNSTHQLQYVGNNQLAYYVNTVNRRFDLTIVSAGTVYIGGALYGPASRGVMFAQNNGGMVNMTTDAVVSGSSYDSKLALLAMDNVCMNPTNLVSVDQPATMTINDEPFWELSRQNPTLNLTVNLPGDVTSDALIFRDAGMAALPGNDAYTSFWLTINGTKCPWCDVSTNPADQTSFYMIPDALQQSNQLFTALPSTQWADDMYDLDAFRVWTLAGLSSTTSPWPWQSNTLYYTSLFQPFQNNTLQFALTPDSTTDYLLGNVAVQKANLEVDALIYAQRGNWFIIPGRYYNENDNNSGASPQNDEPLDQHIIVNGAIVENRPAPQEAQAAWIAHYRSPNAGYYPGGDTTKTVNPQLLDPTYDPSNPGTPAGLANGRWSVWRKGIEYHYDATLTRPVCYTKDFDIDNNPHYSYLPRLPKLPVSPTVFNFGNTLELRALN